MLKESTPTWVTVHKSVCLGYIYNLPRSQHVLKVFLAAGGFIGASSRQLDWSLLIQSTSVGLSEPQLCNSGYLRVMLSRSHCLSTLGRKNSNNMVSFQILRSNFQFSQFPDHFPINGAFSYSDPEQKCS